MSRTLRHRSRGYTIVEILSSMTLFAIGAAGVIAMQRVTIQGGDDARRMDVATNIASEWTFRLQRDATYWTKPNSVDPTSNLLTDTTWLLNAGTTGGTAWLTPPSLSPIAGRSNAFDLFGNDRPPANTDNMFCVQYRFQWISEPGNAPPYNTSALLRAEVRVFWARLDLPNVGNCTAPTLSPDDPAAPTTYHFVYATTAIKMNPSQ